MKKKINTRGLFDKKHFHFGGKVYLSDFNTSVRGRDNFNGSSIAARIESDFRWEKQLAEVKDKQFI